MTVSLFFKRSMAAHHQPSLQSVRSVEFGKVAMTSIGLLSHDLSSSNNASYPNTTASVAPAIDFFAIPQRRGSSPVKALAHPFICNVCGKTLKHQGDLKHRCKPDITTVATSHTLKGMPHPQCLPPSFKQLLANSDTSFTAKQKCFQAVVPTSTDDVSLPFSNDYTHGNDTSAALQGDGKIEPGMEPTFLQQESGEWSIKFEDIGRAHV